MSAGLTSWQGPIQVEWIDFNGHLRDAFYMLLFSYGCDGTLDHIGLDEAGRAANGHSTFTLECHVNYLLEVKEGAQVEVRTQLLAHDAKRMHVFLSLHLAGTEPVLACSEQMWLNVDMATRRSAPYAPAVLARVQALAEQHRALPRPAYIGRVIGLPVPTGNG
ncbi:MAG: thioesterase family protein [Burkholderiaceae bacterium]